MARPMIFRGGMAPPVPLLSFAAWAGQELVCEMLVARGFDLAERDAEGECVSA